MAEQNFLGFEITVPLKVPNAIYSSDGFEGPFENEQDAFDTVKPVLRVIGRRVGIKEYYGAGSNEYKVKQCVWEKDSNDDWIIVESIPPIPDTEKTLQDVIDDSEAAITPGDDIIGTFNNGNKVQNEGGSGGQLSLEGNVALKSSDAENYIQVQDEDVNKGLKIKINGSTGTAGQTIVSKGNNLRWENYNYNDLTNIPNIPANIDKTSDIPLNDGEDGTSSYIEFRDLDATTLPNMDVDSNWTIKKNNGDILNSSTSQNITVDKGSKVDLVTSWKWNTLSTGQLAPTSTSGDISGTTLPSENTFSSPPLSETNIIATTTFSQTMRKPKSGLVVVNGQVVVAAGNDTRSISTKVTFLGRGGLFYDTSTNPTVNKIESEINNASFWSSRNKTFTNVTATGGKYTYIAYDASLGEWNNIVMDDAESQIGAFTKLTNMTITNNAGIAIEMIIYKSNAPDAFGNNKLTIS